MIFCRVTRSLRFKLVVSSVLIQILFVTLLVAHGVNLVEDNLLKQSEVRLHELERLFNAAFGTPMVQQDVEVLQEMLDESVRKDGLTYFVLTDPENQLIASAGVWKTNVIAHPPFVSLAESIQSGAETFYTHTSINVAGIDYGRLDYGISIKSLSNTRSALIADSVLIAIIGIIFSSLALLVVSMWITRHLSNLTKASQAFAAGNLQARVDVNSHDEVRYLAQAFNFMAESLDRRIQDLHDSRGKQEVLLEISHQEKARLTSLLEVMTGGILFETLDGLVAYYNPAFVKIWGLPDSQGIFDKPVTQVLEYVNVGLKTETAKKCLLNKNDRIGGEGDEFELLNGSIIIQRNYPVFDDEKNILGTLWIYEDVTAERQTAKQLVYLAEHDFLTGLYNRRKFSDEMSKQIDMCRRHNTELALVFFDIDDFKTINDAFGHKCGDEMLAKVANDVATLTRLGELFCRLGGDEFAILLPDANLTNAQLLAERILVAVSNISFQFNDQRIGVTSSIGISLFPKHAHQVEELLICADIAMYQAKDAGKNTWKVFEENQLASQQLLKRINWDSRISNALKNGLFEIYYQGVFDSRNNELYYLEALVRMKVEGKDDVILPNQFIPFAERSGKIIAVDRWVLREVIITLAENPSLVRIAVNISGRSFDGSTLAKYIIKLLEIHQVNPRRLVLELTETAVVSDLQDAQKFIDVMHNYGCKIAIDDFGSGYASFVYLKHLQADIVKIDGLFTLDLVNEKDNQLFIKAIVDISHGLNKKTIAEYVEDEASLEMLKALGVDYVQGFYFHSPSENLSWRLQDKKLLNERVVIH